MAIVLGYWNIRGFGEPIRYMLNYANVEFEDKRYFTYESWMDEKFNLNLSFPNLPYLIDGDVRFTQSSAIMRYFARKLQLDGTTDEEKIRAAMAEQQIVDLRDNLVRVCYTASPEESEKLKPGLIENIPVYMKLWSEFLGDRKFLVGDDICYVDFMAYDTFDFYELFYPTAFKDFPNLKEYLNRFEKLPKLQKYLKSSDYKRWPIFQPIAHFGGLGKEPKKL